MVPGVSSEETAMRPTIKCNPGNFEIFEEMKPVHVQTVLPEKVKEALMSKADTTSMKDALLKAVYHFIKCEGTQNEKKKAQESN